MTITKFGHSCLLVETDGVRILIDPGSYSTAQNELADLDVVLITHIHKDHCDIESLKAIRAKNPNVPIYTNGQVQTKLQNEAIESNLLGDGESVTVKGVSIEGFGVDHIHIHSSLPIDKNTGDLIAGRLFHPGDSYTVPNKSVEILALPVGGPWCKIGEAIDYAIAVKPKLAFPIHDAMFADPIRAAQWATKILETRGIPVKIIELNQPIEL